MTDGDSYIIRFNRIGESDIGFISIAENKKIPFAIKRVFWTYFTPEDIVRGRHAHYKTEQILIASAGRIIVNTENLSGKKETFVLEHANEGLYIPPFIWHTMQYSHYSTQLVLTSTEYDEADYIRSYDDFKKLRKEKQ